MWDNPVFEHNPLSRYWKKVIGNRGMSLSSGSIPRHIHGYIEQINPRTESLIRWFPYKQEMTVDGLAVPTFNDVLYTHYFPPQLNDDERVKYTSIKTGRSELEIAEEVFLMRKMKIFCAQLLRNKLKNRPVRLPEGLTYSGLERRYTLGISRVALDMGMSMYTNHSFDPYLLYSPHFGMGDCVDLIVQKQLRTSNQYLFCEVVTHKGVARCRLPQIKDEAKEPLSKLEPCLFDAIKLKLAVAAHLAKQEHYVIDHMFDSGHRYGGCLIHLFPNPVDPEIIDNHVEHIELDLDLAKDFLKHYYDTYVSPRRSMSLK